MAVLLEKGVDVLSLWIDVHPHGKERPRATRTGVFYTPQKTRDYENLIAREIKAAIGAHKLWDGPVRFVLGVYLPIQQSWSQKKKEDARTGKIFPTSKPDFDNLAKSVADAANGIVYKDDAQIVDHVFLKKYEEDKVGLSITFRKLGE